MNHALIIFACHFAYILLIGLQTQNVIAGQYRAAIGTSVMIEVLALYVTGAVAQQFVLHSDWRVMAAYILAGPCGITASMWAYSRLKKWKPGRTHAPR